MHDNGGSEKKIYKKNKRHATSIIIIDSCFLI